MLDFIEAGELPPTCCCTATSNISASSPIDRDTMPRQADRFSSIYSCLLALLKMPDMARLVCSSFFPRLECVLQANNPTSSFLLVVMPLQVHLSIACHLFTTRIL